MASEMHCSADVHQYVVLSHIGARQYLSIKKGVVTSLFRHRWIRAALNLIMGTFQLFPGRTYAVLRRPQAPTSDRGTCSCEGARGRHQAPIISARTSPRQMGCVINASKRDDWDWKDVKMDGDDEVVSPSRQLLCFDNCLFHDLYRGQNPLSITKFMHSCSVSLRGPRWSAKVRVQGHCQHLPAGC